MAEYIKSTKARFQLNPKASGKFRDGAKKITLLEELMYEIPGQDNYGADLRDEAFGAESLSLLDDKPLNAAYYHSTYKALHPDAMGVKKRYRGFADQNLYVAMNTQEKVVPAEFNHCHRNECTTYTQKFSYAIPLEIVYLTPLSKWNPYNLTFHEDRFAPIVDEINGTSPDNALNGTSTGTFTWLLMSSSLR